jgi:hypothetical protein
MIPLSVSGKAPVVVEIVLIEPSLLPLCTFVVNKYNFSFDG